MILHGTSHAVGAICCSVVGSLLVEYVRPYLEDLSIQNFRFEPVWNWLQSYGLKIDLISFLLTTGLLAFLWGMAFKLLHSRRK